MENFQIKDSRGIILDTYFTKRCDCDFRPFGSIYNRSIDEIWYKRAVEQHYFDDESFVFSIPFKDGEYSFVYFNRNLAIRMITNKKVSVEK